MSSNNNDNDLPDDVRSFRQMLRDLAHGQLDRQQSQENNRSRHDVAEVQAVEDAEAYNVSDENHIERHMERLLDLDRRMNGNERYIADPVDGKIPKKQLLKSHLRFFLKEISEGIKSKIKLTIFKKMSQIDSNWYNNLPEWIKGPIMGQIIDKSFERVLERAPNKIMNTIDECIIKSIDETIDEVFDKLEDQDIRSIKL